MDFWTSFFFLFYQNCFQRRFLNLEEEACSAEGLQVCSEHCAVVVAKHGEKCSFLGEQLLISSTT